MTLRWFVPLKPSSGESGGYNRRHTVFEFTTRPFTWKWGFSSGYIGAFTPVRMIVKGGAYGDTWTPVSDWLTPATNDYTFTVDLPDGQYVAFFEGSDNPGVVETLAKPFSMNASGAPLPDELPVWTAPTLFERIYGQCGRGVASIKYPGALPAPVIYPHKKRVSVAFNTVLPMDQMWVRRMSTHIHGAMMRRWNRIPGEKLSDGTTGDGSLVIDVDQKYFYSNVTGGTPLALLPPELTLRDGPRGVGSLGLVYKYIRSPVDLGVYFSDVNGRMGFRFDDGRVITIVGSRLKADELKVHSGVLRANPVKERDYYNSKWEMVGDWIRMPLPHAFNEMWGFAAHGGHHEFWLCDTLNNRIPYVNHLTAHSAASYRMPDYPPSGYVPPAAPTGQSQVVPFWTNIEQPWDCHIHDGWLYASSFTGNQILRKRLTDPFEEEIVVDSSIKPTDTEMGIPTTHRLHQSAFTAKELRRTEPGAIPRFLIDGPPGVGSCVRPQAIAFDSLGRLYWAERYIYAIRRQELDGTITTFAEFPEKFSGKGFGQQDIQMVIDTNGWFGPKDDVFVSCWNESDFRWAADGGYRGRILSMTNKLLSGPAEVTRRPDYAWAMTFGPGKFFFHGNAGGWHDIEVSQRQPTDMVVDIPRAIRGEQNWKDSLFTLTHGPYGQGELGYPNIDEIGSWDDATINAFLVKWNCVNTDEDTLYWIRQDTSNIDYSTALPTVSLAAPQTLSLQVI